MDIVNTINEIQETAKKINIINENNKNNKRSIQSGGFVFGLIASIGDLFILVVRGIIKGLILTARLLFKPSIKRKSKEQAEEIKNPILRLFARIPKPYTKEGEGYLWKYLWFCIKVSFFLVMFALGGIIVTIFGLLYIYRKLYKDYTKIEPYQTMGTNTT